MSDVQPPFWIGKNGNIHSPTAKFWYVCHKSIVTHYLHNDGSWSMTAVSEEIVDGTRKTHLTGYFATHHEAKAALDAAIAAGNVPR